MHFQSEAPPLAPSPRLDGPTLLALGVAIVVMYKILEEAARVISAYSRLHAIASDETGALFRLLTAGPDGSQPESAGDGHGGGNPGNSQGRAAPMAPRHHGTTAWRLWRLIPVGTKLAYGLGMLIAAAGLLARHHVPWHRLEYFTSLWLADKLQPVQAQGCLVFLLRATIVALWLCFEWRSSVPSLSELCWRLHASPPSATGARSTEPAADNKAAEKQAPDLRWFNYAWDWLPEERSSFVAAGRAGVLLGAVAHFTLMQSADTALLLLDNMPLLVAAPVIWLALLIYRIRPGMEKVWSEELLAGDCPPHHMARIVAAQDFDAAGRKPAGPAFEAYVAHLLRSERELLLPQKPDIQDAFNAVLHTRWVHLAACALLTMLVLGAATDSGSSVQAAWAGRHGCSLGASGASVPRSAAHLPPPPLGLSAMPAPLPPCPAQPPCPPSVPCPPQANPGNCRPVQPPAQPPAAPHVQPVTLKWIEQPKRGVAAAAAAAIGAAVASRQRYLAEQQNRQQNQQEAEREAERERLNQLALAAAVKQREAAMASFQAAAAKQQQQLREGKQQQQPQQPAPFVDAPLMGPAVGHAGGFNPKAAAAAATAHPPPPPPWAAPPASSTTTYIYTMLMLGLPFTVAFVCIITNRYPWNPTKFRMGTASRLKVIKKSIRGALAAAAVVEGETSSPGKAASSVKATSSGSGPGAHSSSGHGGGHSGKGSQAKAAAKLLATAREARRLEQQKSLSAAPPAAAAKPTVDATEPAVAASAAASAAGARLAPHTPSKPSPISTPSQRSSMGGSVAVPAGADQKQSGASSRGSSDRSSRSMDSPAADAPAGPTTPECSPPPAAGAKEAEAAAAKHAPALDSNILFTRCFGKRWRDSELPDELVDTSSAEPRRSTTVQRSKGGVPSEPNPLFNMSMRSNARRYTDADLEGIEGLDLGAPPDLPVPQPTPVQPQPLPPRALASKAVDQPAPPSTTKQTLPVDAMPVDTPVKPAALMIPSTPQETPTTDSPVEAKAPTAASSPAGALPHSSPMPAAAVPPTGVHVAAPSPPQPKRAPLTAPPEHCKPRKPSGSGAAEKKSALASPAKAGGKDGAAPSGEAGASTDSGAVQASGKPRNSKAAEEEPAAAAVAAPLTPLQAAAAIAKGKAPLFPRADSAAEHRSGAKALAVAAAAAGDKGKLPVAGGSTNSNFPRSDSAAEQGYSRSGSSSKATGLGAILKLGGSISEHSESLWSNALPLLGDEAPMAYVQQLVEGGSLKDSKQLLVGEAAGVQAGDRPMAANWFFEDLQPPALQALEKAGPALSDGAALSEPLPKGLLAPGMDGLGPTPLPTLRRKSSSQAVDAAANANGLSRKSLPTVLSLSFMSQCSDAAAEEDDAEDPLRVSHMMLEGLSTQDPEVSPLRLQHILPPRPPLPVSQGMTAAGTPTAVVALVAAAAAAAGLGTEAQLTALLQDASNAQLMALLQQLQQLQQAQVLPPNTPAPLAQKHLEAQLQLQLAQLQLQSATLSMQLLEQCHDAPLAHQALPFTSLPFSSPTWAPSPLQPTTSMAQPLPHASGPMDVRRAKASATQPGATNAALAKCALCQSRPRTIGFLHGATAHVCVCQACAANYSIGSPCPMCSQTVESILDISASSSSSSS